MDKTALFFLVFLLTTLASADNGRRGFIGIKMPYYSRDTYTPQVNLTLVFFDNFNDNTLNACWKTFGTAEFLENARTLKSQMKTLKQSSSTGSILCDQAVNISQLPARVTIDQMVPNRNASISSAIFFVPSSARFDNSGQPSECVRLLKRSQMELLESVKDGRTTLLWGRNEPVKPGEFVNYALQIDRKKIILLINGKLIFSGEHEFSGLVSVKPGMWVATKGVSFAGGNMVYDNFTLESGAGKIEEPDTVLDESEPELPGPPQEETEDDSILPPPPPPSAPLVPGEVRETEAEPAAPPAADTGKKTE